jgi:hypothetical protein
MHVLVISSKILPEVLGQRWSGPSDFVGAARLIASGAWRRQLELDETARQSGAACCRSLFSISGSRP